MLYCVTLGCRFSFDCLGPFGDLWGLFRWIFAKGSFGKCKTLKMVNLPGAPPPSNITPLTPPTIRLWVIHTHTHTYTHTHTRKLSPSLSLTHTRKHEHRGEQVCVCNAESNSEHLTVSYEPILLLSLFSPKQMQACLLVGGGPWAVVRAAPTFFEK